MVDGLQTTVYGNHNADNIAIMKKNRYATRMKNIVIAIVLFPSLFFLAPDAKIKVRPSKEHTRANKKKSIT